MIRDCNRRVERRTVDSCENAKLADDMISKLSTKQITNSLLTFLFIPYKDPVTVL
jgi:hypothetical protein